METIILNFRGGTHVTKQMPPMFYTPGAIVWIDKVFVRKQGHPSQPAFELEYDEVFSYFIPPDQSVPEGSS